MHTDENPSDLAEVIGRQVQRFRQHATREDLAQQLNDHGIETSRWTLGRIEDGTRDVTVREWLALALALDVPPVALLAPILGDEQTIDATGNRPMLATNLFQWIAGVEGPIGMGGGSYNAAGTLAGPQPDNDVYLVWLRRKVTGRAWMERVERIDQLEYRQRLHDEGDEFAGHFIRPSDDTIAAAVQERTAVSPLFLGACHRARELGIVSIGLGAQAIQDLAADAGRCRDVDRFMDEHGIRVHTWDDPTDDGGDQ